MTSSNACSKSLVVLGLVVCLLSAWSGPAVALSPRTAVATPASKAPVIDGKLDDACWTTAGVLSDFLSDDGRGIASDNTVVRLCYDDNYLYMGVTCFESDWTTVKAAIDRRDESDPKLDIYQDDDLEIFVDTNRDRQSYYQFLTNSLGISSENLTGNAGWNCDWKVKTTKSDDRWVAEMAFPLASLGKVTEGTAWGFNIGRGQPGKNLYASFAGIQGQWSSPGNFATLRFGKDSTGEGRIFPERKGVRLYALAPERALDLLDLPAPGEEYTRAFATPGEYAPFTFHVVNLEEKAPLTVSIRATEFRGPGNAEIAVPETALLYLYPKMAGGYPWQFLGRGDTVTIKAGQRGGFWLDLPVPADAAPGLYRATVTLSFEGAGPARTERRDLKLLVLPFKLDANPITCGFHYTKERMPEMRESFQIMHDHGMTTVAPIYGGWGVQDIQTYVDLYHEMGFTGSLIYASTEYIGDSIANEMKLPRRGPKLRDSYRTWEVTPEYAQRYVAEMKKYLDEAKRLGHPEMAFSLGDELTVDGRWGAQHLIDRAKALREGLPEIVTTTDASGVFEAVGASKWLTRIGVNNGWGGPDNHNGGQNIITPTVLDQIKANGCKPEFVNTGNGRFPFGLYLWRMHHYGVFSKIEWIWNSDRVSPAWLNVYREGGKTFITVSLKQDRIGTYDVRYAATLENLLKQHPDAAAQQFLDDVVAHIPVDLNQANRSGWSSERADAVRWTLAKHIMRLEGKSVGVAAQTVGAPVGLTLDPSSSWSTTDLTRQFVRHASRTFSAPEVKTAPALDGKLDEPVWQQAQLITGAYDDADLSLAQGMMTVRVLRTSEGVYLGLTTQEPSPEKISAAKEARDNPDLWRFDDVEIFIDPGQTGDYYHLVYDSKGNQTDYRKQDIAWNGNWKVASLVGTDSWTSEVFLPFADFGAPDKPWGIEVGRGSPTLNKFYGIMPIQGSWHDAGQFGKLEFAPLQAYLAAVDFAQLQVGANRADLRILNPTGRPLAATVTLVAGDASTEVKLATTPGVDVKVALPYDLAKSGEQPIEVTLRDAAGAVLDRQSFIAQVPELLSLDLASPSLFSDSTRRTGQLALNLPADRLKDYALEFRLAGNGVNAGRKVDTLTGNQLSWVLNLGPLSEGKYELSVRLLTGGAVKAEKRCDFFMTVPPDFGK